jgi:hypothetical protein
MRTPRSRETKVRLAIAAVIAGLTLMIFTRACETPTIPREIIRERLIPSPGPTVTVVRPGATVTQPGRDRVIREKTTTRTTITRERAASPSPQPTATVTCRPGPRFLGGTC